MPIYASTCTACGHLFEQVRPLSQYDVQPPCPKCDGVCEKAYVPAGTSFNAPAVVVYKTQEGTYRFPGDTNPNGRTAQQYAKLGYERVELKGWAEVRRMEASVGQQQASEIRRRVERQCQLTEQGMSERRAEIRRSMEQGFTMPILDPRGQHTGRTKQVRMTAEAKDFLRHAMDRNDGKPGPKSFDPGFNVEAYSQDRSNRDEGRRADGKRFRD